MKTLLLFLCLTISYGQECILCKNKMIPLKLQGGFSAVESLSDETISKGIYPGSDVITLPNPEIVHYCKSCKYTYNPLGEYYSRESSDPNSFKIKLHDVIRLIPIPDKKMQTRDVCFVQYINSNNEKREYVVARSSENIEIVTKRINDYLTKFDINENKIGDYLFTKQVTWSEENKDSYVRLQVEMGSVLK